MSGCYFGTFAYVAQSMQQLSFAQLSLIIRSKLIFAGGVGCFLMSLPPAAMGVAALYLTDDTQLGDAILNDATMTLPLTVRYLTPPLVG